MLIHDPGAKVSTFGEMCKDFSFFLSRRASFFLGALGILGILGRLGSLESLVPLASLESLGRLGRLA